MRNHLFFVAPIMIILSFLFVAPLSQATLVGTTNQATLTLSPQTGSYTTGSSFSVGVYLNTKDQNVVVVAAYLNYNKNNFQVVSIDTSNSVFTIEAEKDTGATTGLIKITRGIPSPGVKTSNGLVATINFKALTAVSPSSDNLIFQFTAGSSSDSNVILNDGLGTDILSGVYNAKYTNSGNSVSPSPTPTPTVTPTPTPTPSITPTPTPIPNINFLPVGVADYADATKVSGWAYDVDAGTAPIDVHVYVDGVYNGSAPTNQNRPDIVGAISNTVKDPHHGFTYNFSGLSNGSHVVRVYAINTPSGINPELTGSPKTITVGSSTSPLPTPAPTSTPVPTPTPTLPPYSCPSIVMFEPSWCADGTKAYDGVDEHGCRKPLRCAPKPTDCLPEGSLVKLPDDSKIYVIVDCTRKWIQSANEFKQGGYVWSDVKEVTPAVVEAIQKFEEITGLLKSIDSEKIYRIISGHKLWIPSLDVFSAQNLKWDSVQQAQSAEIDQYPRAKLLQAAGDEKVYYITESGMKRHIPTINVFNSYANRWEDIVKVTLTEINSFPDNSLIKVEGDTKVYKLENGYKKWIQTAQAFNRLKLNWAKIAPVNQIELNSYPPGDTIN